MRRALALATGFLFAATACSAPATMAPAEIKPIIENPWVRTTDGAADQSMTALFMSVVNPGKKDITLTGATCPVAGMTELHEMVMVDGKKVMRKIEGAGIVAPAGSHAHLVSGGNHIMLMKLAKALPIGDEITCDLTFDTGQTIQVKAPVKKFTEEADHYHETPGGTPIPKPIPTVAPTK